MGLNLDRRSCRLRPEPQVRRLPVPRSQLRPSSARSPAAPAAICATARSASPARSIRSTTTWSSEIEGHDFDPVKVLQWRTAHFDFSSLDALKRSIETPAPVEGLTRALPAVDAQALEHLSRDPEIRELATAPSGSQLLWEACALPDYRKIAPAQHADLIASMYHRPRRRGHVDENYMAEQVRRADSTDGDIDTLSHRIAQIRTWTFVSNRPGWLADPAHWQEKTREIEDRLSDALHERLTKRFVDRRTSVLMRRLRENTMLEAEISPTGDGPCRRPPCRANCRVSASPPTRAPTAKTPRRSRRPRRRRWPPSSRRAPNASAARANGDIALGSDGLLRWIGAPIGTLAAGEDALKPRVVLLADEQLTGPARDKVAARAERFVNYPDRHAAEAAGRSEERRSTCPASARGSPSSWSENFGVLNRRDVTDEVKALDQEGARRAAPARRPLRRLPYLRAGAAQAGAGRAGHAAVGAETMTARTSRASATCPRARRRPHLGRHRPGLRPHLLQARRLPHARPPRRAHRYSGAPGRPDPPALSWKPGTGRASRRRL